MHIDEWKNDSKSKVKDKDIGVLRIFRGEEEALKPLRKQR